MPTAADTVRAARTRAGISQAALARRADIAQSTISRIESDELDPTWSTMQKLLTATGWAATPEPTESAQLLAADTISRVMARSLQTDDTESAIRDLTEGIGRLIVASKKGIQIPEWVATKPTKPIGIQLWDTFLATAFAYGLEQAGQKPLEWMSEVQPLQEETLPGDDPSPEFRDWLRKRTPAVFMEKNILSRAEDWAIA